MLRIEPASDAAGLTIHVPRADALLFASLIEEAARARGLSPRETDFRQRSAAAIVQATAELLRARPAPKGPPKTV